jgi:hypothetical protein
MRKKIRAKRDREKVIRMRANKVRKENERDGGKENYRRKRDRSKNE